MRPPAYASSEDSRYALRHLSAFSFASGLIILQLFSGRAGGI